LKLIINWLKKLNNWPVSSWLIVKSSINMPASADSSNNFNKFGTVELESRIKRSRIKTEEKRREKREERRECRDVIYYVLRHRNWE
jgi:hypothetical protein